MSALDVGGGPEATDSRDATILPESLKRRLKRHAMRATLPPVLCRCGCGTPLAPNRRRKAFALECLALRKRQRWALAGPQLVPCRCGCRRTFRPRNYKHHAATSACSRLLNNQYRREVRNGGRERREHIGTSLIWQLRKEVPEGLCIYCERPLQGISRLLCKGDDEEARECLRLYNADWRRGQRLKLLSKAPWRKRRTCRLRGCRVRYFPVQPHQLCCCPEHGKAYSKQQQREQRQRERRQRHPVSSKQVILRYRAQRTTHPGDGRARSSTASSSPSATPMAAPSNATRYTDWTE